MKIAIAAAMCVGVSSGLTDVTSALELQNAINSACNGLSGAVTASISSDLTMETADFPGYEGIYIPDNCAVTLTGRETGPGNKIKIERVLDDEVPETGGPSRRNDPVVSGRVITSAGRNSRLILNNLEIKGGVASAAESVNVNIPAFMSSIATQLKDLATKYDGGAILVAHGSATFNDVKFTDNTIANSFKGVGCGVDGSQNAIPTAATGLVTSCGVAAFHGATVECTDCEFDSEACHDLYDEVIGDAYACLTADDSSDPYQLSGAHISASGSTVTASNIQNTKFLRVISMDDSSVHVSNSDISGSFGFHVRSSALIVENVDVRGQNSIENVDEYQRVVGQYAEFTAKNFNYQFTPPSQEEGFDFGSDRDTYGIRVNPTAAIILDCGADATDEVKLPTVSFTTDVQGSFFSGSGIELGSLSLLDQFMTGAFEERAVDLRVGSCGGDGLTSGVSLGGQTNKYIIRIDDESDAKFPAAASGETAKDTLFDGLNGNGLSMKTFDIVYAGVCPERCASSAPTRTAPVLALVPLIAALASLVI